MTRNGLAEMAGDAFGAELPRTYARSLDHAMCMNVERVAAILEIVDPVPALDDD